MSPEVQRDMGRRFGRDFASVRIHADSGAAESARDVNAQAYTVGTDVVFDRGRYDPESAHGAKLLAHELTHVAQQGGADSAAQPATLQRQEAEAAGEAEESAEEDNSLTGRAVRAAIQQAASRAASIMRQVSPTPIPESIMAALLAGIGSFMYRGFIRVVRQGDGLRILGRVRELLNPATAAMFYLKYLWGLIKGLVSPITGLVHLAAGAVRLQIAAVQWLAQLPSRSPELLEEANAVRQAMEEFGGRAQATFQSLRSREQVLAFASAIFAAAGTASEAFQRSMMNEATRQGERAADSLVDHFLETPLPDLAETVGEIVGTVVIEVVLLVFTDGVGNLITKIGEFARALAPLSRGVRAFASVAVRIGRIVATIEHAIGALLSRTVLRPIMPLLEALQPLLARFQRFARRLVGLSESGAEVLAPAATAIAEGSGTAVRTGERGATTATRTAPPRAPTAPPPPPPRPPTVEPPSPPPGGGRPPPMRGVTAEASGPNYPFREHPPVREPEVITRPARGAPPARTPPPRAPEPPPRAPARPTAEERAADLDEVLESTTGGTHRQQAIDTDPSATHAPDEALEGRPTADPTRAGERRATMDVLPRGPRGWQRHHVIPLELREHAAVYEYERLVAGIDNPRAIESIPDRALHQPTNVIELPGSQSTAAGTGMSVHRGSHPRYTSWMENRLDELWSRYRGGGMSVDDFGRAFEDIIGEGQIMLGSGRWGPRVN